MTPLEHLAAPLADFTIHRDRNRDPLVSIDPDATMGVFAEAPQASPGAASGLDFTCEGVDGIRFPQIGDGVAGFRLLTELGRGAFGRVFLAEESLLGNRLVALKITKAEGDEPRILARLQHTHIVPIFSVHDDPTTGLRVMCMPYFGGANLAQVLEAAAANQRSQHDQRSLLKALDIVAMPPPSEAMGSERLRRRTTVRSSATEPGSQPSNQPPLGATLVAGLLTPKSPRSGQNKVTTRPNGANPGRNTSAARWSILNQLPRWKRSISSKRNWSRHDLPEGNDRDPVQPARRFLREANFIRAAAWVIARLAEGLEHAHSHGLMHRDLKPSNILIAADGTPMLLDFNLAADSTVKAEEADRVRMGGTLPYMAPEHLDAFHPNGTTPPEAVGERSDIYAMGLILFEMIAGQRPFGDPEPDQPLLLTIRHMIDERRAGAPSLRAIDPNMPRDLDAVVRKCLDPNPERRHARAGDLAEDLRRFLDDQPLKYTTEPSWRGRVAKWLRRNPRATGASTVGTVGLVVVLGLCSVAWTVHRHLTLVSAHLKLKGFEERFARCQWSLNTTGPTENLGAGITLAEETLAQAGISLDIDQDRRSDGWLEKLDRNEQNEARGNLAEVMMLVARARIYLADQTRMPDKQKNAALKAIAWLDRAEVIDPTPTITLYEDRAEYLTRVGETARATRDRALAAKLSPTTGRDFYLLGTSLLNRSQPDKAETALSKAIGLSPQGFWPWFALGLCHYDQKRFAESAGDFAVCTVLSPRFAWPWVNRGLALGKAGRLNEARSALDHALEIDGTISDALANRALIALELGDAPAAVVDFDQAYALGRREVFLQAARGEALGRAGQTTEALRLLDTLIEQNPDELMPRIARGALYLHSNPSAAEADYHYVLLREPQNVGALMGLARLKRLTDPRKSLAYAILAQQVDPNRIDAIEHSAWLRGKLGDPGVMTDVERLVLHPTALRLYNAGCSLALYYNHQSDPKIADQAIGYIRRAVQSGVSRSMVQTDPDLISLHSVPAFKDLIGSVLADKATNQP